MQATTLDSLELWLFYCLQLCIVAMTVHIHTRGSFINHAVCSLSSILVMAISVVDEMKIGNTAPRAEIKHNAFALLDNVVSLGGGH